MARYGAAARISGEYGEYNDGGGAETVEALAFNVESLHGPGQLPEAAGEMPLAGRSAAHATNDAGTRDAVEGVVAVSKIIAASRR
jgi:hypothetical protein